MCGDGPLSVGDCGDGEDASSRLRKLRFSTLVRTLLGGSHHRSSTLLSSTGLARRTIPHSANVPTARTTIFYRKRELVALWTCGNGEVSASRHHAWRSSLGVPRTR